MANKAGFSERVQQKKHASLFPIHFFQTGADRSFLGFSVLVEFEFENGPCLLSGMATSCFKTPIALITVAIILFKQPKSSKYRESKAQVDTMELLGAFGRPSGGRLTSPRVQKYRRGLNNCQLYGLILLVELSVRHLKHTSKWYRKFLARAVHFKIMGFCVGLPPSA